MEKTTIDGMENTSNHDTDRICSYDDIPLFLDANDIERLLGLSLTNIYYMFRAEDFPTIVIGKRRLVRKEKLLDWIVAHEKQV
jgi:predicted DNA-binding transcriptional regulator AlpA